MVVALELLEQKRSRLAALRFASFRVGVNQMIQSHAALLIHRSLAGLLLLFLFELEIHSEAPDGSV
jgi:hypothetical protein